MPHIAGDDKMVWLQTVLPPHIDEEIEIAVRATYREHIFAIEIHLEISHLIVCVGYAVMHYQELLGAQTEFLATLRHIVVTRYVKIVDILVATGIHHVFVIYLAKQPSFALVGEVDCHERFMMPLKVEQTAEKSIVDCVELLPTHYVVELFAVAQ